MDERKEEGTNEKWKGQKGRKKRRKQKKEGIK